MNNQKQIALLEATINQELQDIAECEADILKELEGIGESPEVLKDINSELMELQSNVDKGQYLLDLIENHDLSEYYGQYSVGYVAGLRMAINLLKNL